MKIMDRMYTPQEISAIIYRDEEDGGRLSRSAVTEAVITVPLTSTIHGVMQPKRVKLRV
jgi:hypothetical protein